MFTVKKTLAKIESGSGEWRCNLVNTGGANDRVDIRMHYPDKSNPGEMVHSRKGMTLDLEDIPDIRKLLDTGAEALEA